MNHVYCNIILVKYHAINLLKQLGITYDNLISGYIRPNIDTMMNSYVDNPSKNGSSKIAAINLLFACTIKNFSNMSILIY